MLRYLSFTFLGFIWACGPNPNTDTIESSDLITPRSTDTILYRVKVDNLRLRKDSSLSAETVVMLPEGSLVRYWGDQSVERFEVSLRGSDITGNWYRVSFGSQSGWAFSGALELAEHTEDYQNLILPGEKVGPIQAEDTEQSVIDKLGAENVSRRTIQIGEGESVEGTVVYPGTPRELLLLWQQQDYTNLAEVRIERPDSPWKTNLGLAMGSTLKKIENLNGDTFLITGFGWDYGGTSIDWKRGSMTDKVVLIFEEPERVHSSLLGDHAVPSNDRRLSRSNPKVRQIRILF